MSRAKRYFLCIGLLVSLLGVWALGGFRTPADNRTDADTRFDENKSLFAKIQAADQLILFEGLPHEFWEAKQLAEEQKRKDTVTRHGYPFYRTPLDVVAEDKEKLKALLGDAGSFREWRGEKKCGGFHPDYLAEWRVGPDRYRVLICFGCCEIKAYGPDGSLRCDMHGETREHLLELLKKYRKNRPEAQEP